MGLINRPVRAGAVAVIGLAISAYTGAMATGAMAAPATSGPHFAVIRGSVSPTTDAITGGYHSARMSIEIALAPRNAAGLARSLKALYTKHSGSYHKWLATGRFDARYAPTSATRAGVRDYLRSQGFGIAKSSSPFLVRAVGSSRQVSAAFHTTLSNFRDPRGVRYFANSRPVEMPAAIASHVLGVIGLTNTAREHTDIIRAPHSTRGAGQMHPADATCQTPYPTEQQLAEALLGVSGFPFGYGGGPGCNGLTPDQTNSLYHAPHVGARGKGARVNIAVFELSAYLESDVDTYAHTFFGPNFTPSLVNVNVDGGPQNPQCPAGDSCLPADEAFAGDIEVDADIETQLAISPDVSNVIVYNAPNDNEGITNLDELAKIASDNTADAVSSSWAVCENDAPEALVEAENVVFEQMALQGQSMFGAEGDTGAFSCIRSDGTTIVNVLDPPSQPWVTSVGGTSFENFNPDFDPSPAYPANAETVWNFLNLCNSGPGSDGLTGFQWCAGGGATGGGNSQWWGRPFYQRGPGVSNTFSTVGNGTTQCALAAVGTPCREDPDISANADENTPYAEFCTGNANTPGSSCGTFSQFQNPPGWFGIGGTSLSSPLWSGIAADRVSFEHGRRTGNLNPLLYLMYDLAPSAFFHDINGAGQVENNNGLFPTVAGYDQSTGIGTPIMSRIIMTRL